MHKKELLTLLLSGYSLFVFAQQGIKGKVTDDTRQAFPDCGVYVESTNFFTRTDSLGNFTLVIPPGEHTIKYIAPDFLHLAEKVTVTKDYFNDEVIILEKEEREEKMIEGITVVGQASNKNEANMVSIQKKSVEMVENVSAVQLQKQGVGNVASAVAKATGTLRQAGTGTIFIRGLGERYNSTTLNGLSIPSNDPEYKNIDLSLFKTDIVEYIGLEKVFSSRISGDVAGANINITSKEHRGKAYVKVGLGSSINTLAISQGSFWQKDGTDFFGFRDNKMPANPLTGYNFTTSWNWRKVNNPFSSGLALEAGKSFNIGQDGKISLFGTLSFDNEYVYSKGFEKNINAQGFATKNLSSQKYDYSTNTTGLTNVAYKINAKNKISYNLLFIHTSDQTNRLMQGYIKDIAEDHTGQIKRAEYKLSTLWINQLLGEHNLSDRWIFRWSAAYNDLESKTPDRQQTTVKNSELGTGFIFISNSDSDQNRYFDELQEKEYTGGISLDYLFGKDKESKITLGYQGRDKRRDFEATQINFKVQGNEVKADINDFDSFFNQDNFNSKLYWIRTFRGNSGVPNALLPSQFKGTQTIHAGFANIEYKLSDKWIAQIGARIETVTQKINWDTNLSASTEDKKLDKTKFLPSLNLKYAVNDRNNLRFASSKTYTMPQFKEIAPFYYEDVTEISFGNPYLYPSDNYNADLKWEFFPKSGEVFSIAAFGKYIKNPIAKLTIASSANESSYANVGDWAYVYGAEIEFRKDIFKFERGKLYTFLNTTLMNTKSELNEDKVKKETRNFINPSFDTDEDELQGASRLLANANLGYNQKIGDISLDAVLSYSYIGQNIYSLSYGKTGNLVDQDLHLLDFNLKLNLSKNTAIKISMKNLLNPKYERMQKTPVGDLTQEYYNRGRFFGFEISQQL
ncbi:MAG: TonB-dependent receptor [Flavobacteriaceae bacterium]|jgi:hypothetical protein|nr:TonB-dependent receptor [Flavobacteriaceae bacterium]